MFKCYLPTKSVTHLNRQRLANNFPIYILCTLHCGKTVLKTLTISIVVAWEMALLDTCIFCLPICLCV